MTMTRDQLRVAMRAEFGDDYIIVYRFKNEWITTSSNFPGDTGRILRELGNKILTGIRKV